MLLGFTLFDPSTLAGLLSPILFLVAIGLGAWAYARVHIAKAQDSAIDTWRQNYEAQKQRAELAAAEAAEQREAKHGLATALAAEQLKTDQTIVLGEIVAFHKEFAAREVLFERILASQEAARTEVQLQMKQAEERVVALIHKQSETLERVVRIVVNGKGE